MRRFRSLSINLSLSIVTIILMLLATEGLLAWWDKYPPRPRSYVGEYQDRPGRDFVVDKEVGWRMRPSHAFVWKIDGTSLRYYADKQGFRISNRDSNETEGIRVVMLGDSFMWGTGVAYEQTAGHYIESAFDSLIVYNLAMPGFGVDQIRQSLEHWAMPLQPDAVVIGLYTEDFDRPFFAFRNGVNKPTFKLEGGQLVEMTTRDRPGWLLHFLERHSYVFTLGRRVDRWFGLKYGLGSWWALNGAFIDAMKEISEKANIPILFIHIPWKNGTPFPGLQSHMKDTGMDFIDLNTQWKSPKERLSCYFERDDHLNATGQKFMSRLIIQWIQTKVATTF